MRRPGIEDPWDAYGQCAIESFDLAGRKGYALVRVTGLAYPGREHWACLTGDLADWQGLRVVDLTARQFTTRVPARYEVDLDTWLDDACEWLGDGLRYEIYQDEARWHREEPLHADHWIREDVDPDEFTREEAWREAV